MFQIVTVRGRKFSETRTLEATIGPLPESFAAEDEVLLRITKSQPGLEPALVLEVSSAAATENGSTLTFSGDEYTLTLAAADLDLEPRLYDAEYLFQDESEANALKTIGLGILTVLAA